MYKDSLLKSTEVIRPFAHYALRLDDYTFLDLSLADTQISSRPLYWRLKERRSLLEVVLDNPSGILVSFRIIFFTGEMQALQPYEGTLPAEEMGIPKFSIDLWRKGQEHSIAQQHLLDFSRKFEIQLGAESLRIVLERDSPAHRIRLPGRGSCELNSNRQLCSFFFDDIKSRESEAIRNYVRLHPSK